MAEESEQFCQVPIGRVVGRISVIRRKWARDSLLFVLFLTYVNVVDTITV